MIKLILGDITTLKVDAIVNAANAELAPGGGVDGAIRRAAGHELNEACDRLGGCPTGEARLTLGFHLPAKYVIHTAGPVWHGGDHDEAELLRQSYRSCFKQAMDRDVESIAFPCISTGVYGFPKEKAATIALKEMRFFENKFDEIIICCHSEGDRRIYLQLIGD